MKIKEKIKNIISNLVTKLKRSVRKLRYFFPSPLPLGVTEFNNWAQSIIDTYNLPNNDTVVGALGVMIAQLGPSEASKPKRYFGMCVRKTMANQVGHSRFQEIKAEYNRKLAEEKAAIEAAAKNQEVTAPPVTSNGQQ